MFKAKSARNTIINTRPLPGARLLTCLDCSGTERKVIPPNPAFYRSQHSSSTRRSQHTQEENPRHNPAEMLMQKMQTSGWRSLESAVHGTRIRLKNGRVGQRKKSCYIIHRISRSLGKSQAVGPLDSLTNFFNF